MIHLLEIDNRDIFDCCCELKVVYYCEPSKFRIKLCYKYGQFYTTVNIVIQLLNLV